MKELRKGGLSALSLALGEKERNFFEKKSQV